MHIAHDCLRYWNANKWGWESCVQNQLWQRWVTASILSFLYRKDMRRSLLFYEVYYFRFLSRFGFAWVWLLACHLSVSIPECTSPHYTVNTAMTLCGVSCSSALVGGRGFASLAVESSMCCDAPSGGSTSSALVMMKPKCGWTASSSGEEVQILSSGSLQFLPLSWNLSNS